MMTDAALAYLQSSDSCEIGVDQTAFLLCKEQSAREWFPVFMGTITGTELYAVKWRNWKVHFFWQEWQDESLKTFITHAWVLHAMFQSLAPFQESLKKYPPIPMGTSDPYTPEVAQ
jgi:hypothetical protein